MMAKLRTLRNEYRRNNGKYYASVRQLREYKKEQEQISKNLNWLLCLLYETEIALYDNLAIFLEGFLSLGIKNNVALGVDVSKVEDMFVKRRDEDAFFAADALKLPFATMGNLLDIKLTVPAKISEIPNTIQRLKERKKKKNFIKEQLQVTEANKRKTKGTKERRILSVSTIKKQNRGEIKYMHPCFRLAGNNHEL
ncbi:hypothetical protein G6F56_009834 [Rhizopus delemar]|nr:hypothetical protein G6F56_009834 [Rhizopus delemar]